MFLCHERNNCEQALETLGSENQRVTDPSEAGFFGISPWIAADLSGSGKTNQSTRMPWSAQIVGWFFFFADVPLQPEDLQIILPALDAPDDIPVEARRERLSRIRRISWIVTMHVRAGH